MQPSRLLLRPFTSTHVTANSLQSSQVDTSVDSLDSVVNQGEGTQTLQTILEKAENMTLEDNMNQRIIGKLFV